MMGVYGHDRDGRFSVRVFSVLQPEPGTLVDVQVNHVTYRFTVPEDSVNRNVYLCRYISWRGGVGSGHTQNVTTMDHKGKVITYCDCPVIEIITNVGVFVGDTVSVYMGSDVNSCRYLVSEICAVFSAWEFR